MRDYMIKKEMRARARAGTPEAIAERLRHRKACELARAETVARYPVVTTENAREAIEYQEHRIQQHLRKGE